MAKAKLFVIAVADRPGTAAGVIGALAGAKVNVLSILAWNPSGTVQIVTDNSKKARKALAGAGVAYSESAAEVVELANKPGTLVGYLDRLAKKNINLRSVCATASKNAKRATVVWTAEG